MMVFLVKGPRKRARGDIHGLDKLRRYGRCRPERTKTARISRYLLVCRTIIKFTSHPRQNPYEGCTSRVKRIDHQCMRNRRGHNKASTTYRVCYAGVCVCLRRIDPPHGGAHVGRSAAAQEASCGGFVTEFRAGGAWAAPAPPGQAVLVRAERPDYCRSLAFSALSGMTVVNHPDLALTRNKPSCAWHSATGVGRRPCAKTRWQV